MMNALIDEASRRRPEFRGGRPITLTDGQEWTIPVPEKFYAFANNETGFTEFTKFGSERSPDYDALVVEYERSFDEDSDKFVSATLKVMRFLILVNYEVSDDEIADLIQIRFGGSKADPIYSAFFEAARAIEAPKEPTPVGSHLL